MRSNRVGDDLIGARGRFRMSRPAWCRKIVYLVVGGHQDVGVEPRTPSSSEPTMRCRCRSSQRPAVLNRVAGVQPALACRGRWCTLLLRTGCSLLTLSELSTPRTGRTRGPPGTARRSGRDWASVNWRRRSGRRIGTVPTSLSWTADAVGRWHRRSPANPHRVPGVPSCDRHWSR